MLSEHMEQPGAVLGAMCDGWLTSMELSVCYIHCLA